MENGIDERRREDAGDRKGEVSEEGFGGDERQQRAKSQNDVISCLPDDILILILNSLPIQEVARTTILSKRWRPLFGRIPTLSFEKDLKSHQYDAILSTLSARDGVPIKTCKVVLQCRKDQIETVVSSICACVVENVALKLFYPIPACLLSCSSLVELSLSQCKIDDSIGQVALPRLKRLHLEYVQLNDIWLQTTIPLCGCLQELVIKECLGVDNFVLRSNSLSIVRFVYFYEFRKVCFKEATNLREVDIVHGIGWSSYSDDVVWAWESLLGFFSQIQTVKTLSFFVSDYLFRVLKNKQLDLRLPNDIAPRSLKKLVLKMDFSNDSTNSFIYCLLQRCSNLEELYVENYYWGTFFEENASFWEMQKFFPCLLHLKRVTLKSKNDNFNVLLGFANLLLLHLELEQITILRKHGSTGQPFPSLLPLRPNLRCEFLSY